MNSLDTRARRLVEEYTVSNGYMPLSVYNTFKDKYQALREEYLSCAKEISDQWEEIQEQFTKGVVTMVNFCGDQMTGAEQENLIKNLTKNLPDAQEYLNRAYMTLDVRAFPTTGITAEGLEPDIQEELNRTWKNDVCNNAVKAIEQNIGELFAKASQICNKYSQTGRIDSRSAESMSSIASRVRKLNVFCNPLLEDLAARLETLKSRKDDEAEEIIEDSLIDIWNYAKKTGISLDLESCPLSRELLEKMSELRSKISA